MIRTAFSGHPRLAARPAPLDRPADPTRRPRPARRELRLVPAAIALALLLPSAAAGATLTSTPHGPVDLGDRVAYRVSGADCEKVGVAARITAGPDGRVVRGPRSTPRASADGGCAGIVRVPDFAALRATGWEPGDRLDVELESRLGTVPLRFARIEADLGRPAAGSPEIVPARDQDTGERDRAVRSSTGDVVSLGRVDLRRADSVGVRLCVTAGLDTAALPSVGPLLTPERLEPPTLISIRQNGPDGPPLVGPVDVASDPQEISRLSTLGFGGCYRLVVLPITGRVQEDAPELFLRTEAGLPGGLLVNSVDIAGTGAKLPPEAPPAPAGMRTIFDGTSFDGWDASACVLRDGAAVNARSGNDLTIAGCSLTWREPMENVVLRFRMRRENIYDNAGIYLDAQEIQLRAVGEYLPGGYFGQFAARWQKQNTFPDYDEIEVVQLGARHVVTVNGRTVTDVMRAGGPPAPYRLQVVAQPEWSYRVGAEAGFGNEGFPDVTRPNELGAFWFKDVRVLRCDGPDDPVCRRLADARRGQVPVPQGAPDPLPPEPAAAARCGARRAFVVTLPRTGLRRVSATVDGRRVAVRRVGARRVRIVLPARALGRYRVRVTARTTAGRLVRADRRPRACG